MTLFQEYTKGCIPFDPIKPTKPTKTNWNQTTANGIASLLSGFLWNIETKKRGSETNNNNKNKRMAENTLVTFSLIQGLTEEEKELKLLIKSLEEDFHYPLFSYPSIFNYSVM